MNTLAVTVQGTPIPQGSKNAYNRGGRIVLVESAKGLPTYRKTIIEAVKDAAAGSEFRKVTRPGAVAVTVKFFFTRPKSNRNSFHIVKPDTDKLLRSILDALTQSGVVFDDDSQVVSAYATKQYTPDNPQTFIEVTAYATA